MQLAKFGKIIVLDQQKVLYLIERKDIVLMASEPDKKQDERKFELRNIFRLSGIISIKEGKPKASKYTRALESTYKFRTDSGRKLSSAIENKFYSFQISSYAFDNVENIKLKQKYPNFKTTMKKGLIACLMDNPVSEISFTVDAKKEGLISKTGLTFDCKDF